MTSSSEAAHPWAEPDPEEQGTPRLAAQWFALLGGMSAYAVHLMAGVMLVPLACGIRSTWPIHTLTIAMSVVILASIWVSWVVRQRAAPEVDDEAPAGERRVGADIGDDDYVDPPGSVKVGVRRRARYFANLGLLLNPLALLIVLVTEVNVHIYDPCLP